MSDNICDIRNDKVNIIQEALIFDNIQDYQASNNHYNIIGIQVANFNNNIQKKWANIYNYIQDIIIPYMNFPQQLAQPGLQLAKQNNSLSSSVGYFIYITP